MSGLVFSLLLGAVATELLDSILTKDLGLDRTPVKDAWRGFIQEDGYRVEVLVRRVGDRIEFILPDESIPEEICKRVVKRLSALLYARLKIREISYEDIQIVGPTPTFCRYCLEPIVGFPFRCRRCGDIYCSDHRLPERHDCLGEKEVTAKVAVKEKKREKKKAKKKVVVTQAACG